MEDFSDYLFEKYYNDSINFINSKHGLSEKMSEFICVFGTEIFNIAKSSFEDIFTDKDSKISRSLYLVAIVDIINDAKKCKHLNIIDSYIKICVYENCEKKDFFEKIYQKLLFNNILESFKLKLSKFISGEINTNSLLTLTNKDVIPHLLSFILNGIPFKIRGNYIEEAKELILVFKQLESIALSDGSNKFH